MNKSTEQMPQEMQQVVSRNRKLGKWLAALSAIALLFYYLTTIFYIQAGRALPQPLPMPIPEDIPQTVLTLFAKESIDPKDENILINHATSFGMHFFFFVILLYVFIHLLREKLYKASIITLSFTVIFSIAAFFHLSSFLKVKDSEFAPSSERQQILDIVELHDYSALHEKLSRYKSRPDVNYLLAQVALADKANPDKEMIEQALLYADKNKGADNSHIRYALEVAAYGQARSVEAQSYLTESNKKHAQLSVYGKYSLTIAGLLSLVVGLGFLIWNNIRHRINSISSMLFKISDNNAVGFTLKEKGAIHEK